MRTITLWKWRYRDPLTGRMTTTRHLATEDDARTQLPPDAERIEHTREDRRAPETQEEMQGLRTGQLAR